MKWKRSLLFAALALLAAPASASLCSLVLSKDLSCTFPTDTSGGTAVYTNPTNLSNIGSGVINPFLTQQKNGTEGGVSTDNPIVNTLPLDDKRDNTNTFTTTFQLNQLGFVTVGGVDYFTFFLDINEPNGGDQNLLSLDTLRIWGRAGTTGETDPFMLTNTNVTSLADLDLLPNLQLVYALGNNTLLMDYNLFAGSGLGYDLSLLIPTSAFAGLAADSRILFSSSFGLAGGTLPGADAADGFEEWAYLKGSGPRVTKIPEPGSLALLGLALIGMGYLRRVKQ